MRNEIRFGDKVTVTWVRAEGTGVFISSAVSLGMQLTVWTPEVMAWV